MDSSELTLCTPALVYAIISLIVMCVGVMLMFYKSGFTSNGVMSASIGSCSQLCFIFCCTIILMFCCNMSPIISWIIAGILICCMCSGLGGTLYKL